MVKRVNPNRVKIHRNYTVEEIANLLSVHKNTVRVWVKSGLPLIDKKRPCLILGRELREYLEAKRAKHKKCCKADELYCLKCKSPQHPAGEMAEYQATNSTRGRLIGICPSCDGLMNKYTTLANLALIEGKLDITKLKAP